MFLLIRVPGSVWRWNFRFGILSAGLVAGLFLSIVAPCAGSTLERYRGSYAEHLSNYEEQAGEQLDALPQKYLGALDQLERELQKGGDLDGILLVRKEKRRFGEEGKVPDKPNPLLPAALQNLQSQYADAVRGIETEKALNIDKLVGQYLKAMEEIKRKLTTEGEVEKAMEVHFEIATVKSSEEVKWARERMALSTPEPDVEEDKEESPPAQGSDLEERLRNQRIGYLRYSWSSYGFDDAIDALLDHLYPRGITIRLASSGRISVRSVSYAEGGKPNYYAECGMPEWPSWTRYLSVELQEISALSALEYVCADYGLGYKLDGNTILIADKPDDETYRHSRLISAADFGQLFEEGAIGAIREYKGRTFRIWGDISGVGKALGGRTYVELESVRPLRLEFADADERTTQSLDKMVDEFHKSSKDGGTTYYDGAYYSSSSSRGREQRVGLIVTATCDSLSGTKVVLKDARTVHWKRYTR